VDNNDILFAMIGTIGNPVLVEKEREFSIKNTALFKLSGSQVSPRYFLRLLDSRMIRQQLDSATRGGTQKFVSLKVLRGLTFSLPPLPEQKRIAQILDAADALRAKRRESIAQLDALVQSTFLEMFGDPVRNPKGWPRYPLEDLCNRVVDCAHSTPKYSDIATGLFCVRSSDIQNGDLVLTDALHVDQNVYDERISRHEPMEGEVIYTREGGRLGLVGLVPAGKKICLGQRMMLFNASPDVALNTYIWGFLHCSSTYKTVLSMSGGGAAPRVNIKQLKKLSAICPPIDSQKIFQSAIQAIQIQKYLLQQHLTELNTLFASLQSRAFNGEL